MQVRRTDDRRLRLVLARPTGWISGGDVATRRTGRRRELSPPERMQMNDGLPDRVERGEDLVLLLDGPDGEGVLVTGAVAGRVPQGRQDPDLMDRAAVGAAVFMRERLRTEKRQQLPDQLIVYFEELNAAESDGQVMRALADHALRIVGAHTAVALMREPSGLLRAAQPADPCACRARLCLGWDERFAAPGLIVSEDARPGGAIPAAAPLFGDPHTALVAHVPVGGEAVLVLTERREERIFEPEDWDVMRALALQAQMALRRLKLLEDVRTLSLTDPLTGLGNRRHLELMLAHAWAAARRGDPLAVVVVDLDGFKEVNDTLGHQAGDELLCAVAGALRDEVRASDLVVRFGGDEFLALLTGGTAEGGHLLIERVRRRLGGSVGISAGVAAYVPEMTSAEELIRLADRRLYDSRAGRRGAHVR